MTKPMPKLEMGSIEVLSPDGFEGVPYDEAIIYFEGFDSLSEIEVRCPGALRLAPLIVKAVNSHDALVKALTDARTAIASLSMEALGYASAPNGEQIHWPIRDELLHRIDEALRSVAPHPAAEPPTAFTP